MRQKVTVRLYEVDKMNVIRKRRQQSQSEYIDSLIRKDKWPKKTTSTPVKTLTSIVSSEKLRWYQATLIVLERTTDY